MSDLADMVSAVATSVAAIAALISTRLSYHQLSRQFDPAIVANGKDYTIGVSFDNFRNMQWEGPLGEDGQYIRDGLYDEYIDIVNVGRGNAYNLKVSMYFHVEGVFGDLANKLGNYAPGLSIDTSEQFAHIIFPGQGGAMYQIPGAISASFDVLYPSANTGSKCSVRIDSCLKAAAMGYAYYQAMAFDSPRPSPTDRIQFFLIVEYTDASKGRHSIRIPMEFILSLRREPAGTRNTTAIIELRNRTDP